jgi:hypothetical protein
MQQDGPGPAHALAEQGRDRLAGERQLLAPTQRALPERSRSGSRHVPSLHGFL